jgi:hypothetical protein
MIGAASSCKATKNIFAQGADQASEAEKPIGGLGRMRGGRTACLLVLISWGSLMSAGHFFICSPTGLPYSAAR